MRTINVNDFIKWLNDDIEMELTFTQKAVIKYVVDKYADKYGLEVVQKQEQVLAYEKWLDEEFAWAGEGVIDISQGLKTYTYNMLRRCGWFDDDTKKWIYPLKTNRDISKATDTFIRQHSRISKNGIKEIREYLDYHKKKFLGEEEKPKTCIRQCSTCKNSSYESCYAWEHGRKKCNLTDKEHDYRDCCENWESEE